MVLNETYLKIRRERIRKSHVSWKSTQNQIPHLNTVWWNYIAKTEVIITEEFWEIMQQH